MQRNNLAKEASGRLSFAPSIGSQTTATQLHTEQDVEMFACVSKLDMAAESDRQFLSPKHVEPFRAQGDLEVGCFVN